MKGDEVRGKREEGVAGEADDYEGFVTVICALY